MSHSHFEPNCPCIAHGPFALFEVHVLTAFPRAPQVVILSYFRLRRCPMRHFDRICMCFQCVCRLFCSGPELFRISDLWWLAGAAHTLRACVSRVM